MIELATDQSVEEILNRGFYVIPRFQRAYSWTADNVGDFWTDTVQSDSENYFIGSVIVYELGDTDSQRRQSPEYAVVDGQQRLTTITILLAAVRDALLEQAAALGEGDQEELAAECRELAEGVQSFVERSDRRARRRRILSSEAGYPYLQTYVQSMEAREPDGQAVRPDERRIEAAFTYFRSQLRDLVDATRRDPTIPEERRHRSIVDRLERVRDRILNLSIILVVVDNDDDAYEIFETLNTRGQDLNLADLVRNFLLRDLREEAEGVDSAKTRYTAILENLHDPEAPIEPSQFLLHSWLSREEYTSGKRLFRDMKRRIDGVAAKRAYLAALEVDVPLYRKARYPRQADWGQHREIGESIDALIVFRMSQPLPLVLAGLRAWDERRLTLRNLRKLLNAIEAFHFRFTAVAGRSSSGGVSKRYASAARQLTRSDPTRTADVASGLIGRLREAVPTQAEFDAGFAQLRYWSGDVGQKQLIQYILKRLYAHGSDGSVAVDFSSMTIEHLAAERAEQDAQLTPDEFGSIGNLILVSADLNRRLANKSWPAKRALLQQQREVWIPPAILEAEVWGPTEIAGRAAAMADVAQHDVWRV